MDSSQQGEDARRELARLEVDLCRVYYPRLRAMYVKCGLQHHDVEDALQELFLRTLKAWARGALPVERFEGWLFEVARRVVADHYRGRRRRERLLPLPEEIPAPAARRSSLAA